MSIPEGWGSRPLAELASQTISYGIVQPGGYVENGIRMVRGGDFPQNEIILENVKSVSPEVADAYSRTVLCGGEILVSLVGYPGATTIVPEALAGANIARNAAIIVPADDIDTEFLRYYLLSSQGQYEMLRTSAGSAQQVVNLKDLRKVVVWLPPLPEQRRIAEILGTWDRAIAVAERAVQLAQDQKTALMQQLLTPTRRLPGFAGDWEEVKLKAVFERVRDKNTVGKDNVLTISAQDGLVSQEEYFNKRVAARDLSKYTLLQRGDFAYNKSYSNGYPMGAIKALHRYDSGVVSSLYICFRLAPGKNSHSFYRHYFEGGHFNREIYAFAQEGARNHGLLNMAIGDFFNGKVKRPSPAEQNAIASVIDEAQHKVDTETANLTHLRDETTALMQQLLTGRRRVQVEV